MKRFFIVFALIAVVLAVYPFLNPSDHPQKLSGLPWQIEILPDGHSRVFGITIGQSRLSDALQSLGGDMQLAIVAATDEGGSLEMYYGHYKAGLLSGKLVLQTQAGADAIRRWRENSPKSEYMATGMAKKYLINDTDATAVLNEVITGITFIPAVNLDEDVILARFGTPAERIEREGVTHFLYPDKGLHIALSDRDKEVLQYVAPGDFAQWVKPLRNKAEL